MRGVILLMGAVSAANCFAALTVVEHPADGGLRILRDGKPIVESVAVGLGGDGKMPQPQRSFVVREDGAKVWNRWCEERERRYRLEVAQRADGAVEITLSGQMEGSSPYRARTVHLRTAAGAFDGKSVKGLTGDGRAWRPLESAVGPSFRNEAFRWLACDGVTFDFNPLGATDFCMRYNFGVVQGAWSAFMRDGVLNILGGTTVKFAAGGFVGAKVIIREGGFDDYDRHHLIRTFWYTDHLKSKYLTAFASPKRGKGFAEGDVPFDAARGFGWVGDVPRRPVVGAPSGVRYSCVAGEGPAVYRFAGLADGYYVFNLVAGNYTGERNGFSVSVNGETIVRDVTVRPRTSRSIARAIHVRGGTTDVTLDGNWLVSCLALQPVMGDSEDFSVSRGYWLTEGYEPGDIYCSADCRRPPAFGLADETCDLPEPGTESAAAWRDPPAPVNVPDLTAPSYDWLRRVRMGSLLSNSSTFGEYDDPAELERALVAEVDSNRCNAAIVSGMHSRHTYFNHIDRGVEAIGRIAAGLHRHGAKHVDHHDSTLLWNSDGGLRTLMTRLPELCRASADGLPSFQLCPSNPTFRETYYAYLRRLAEKGVDGFQIDELEFFGHACVCAACRERFHRETGWHLPADETHPCFSDPRDPIARRWHVWRTRTITNFFVELRERLRDVKPDLSLQMYTTHWGFTRSLPNYRASPDLFDFARTVNYFGTEVTAQNPIATARPMLPLRKAFNLFPLAVNAPPPWVWFYSYTRGQNLFCWGVSQLCGQQAVLERNYPAEPGIPDYDAFAASDLAFKRAGAVCLAKVALVFSASSRDWNRRTSFVGELFGVAQALEALHVPYEIVGDRYLDPDRLAKYRVLFLCGSECLSDRAVADVRAFAARGGTVQMSETAGTCDEFGLERAENPFRDLPGKVVRRPASWATPYHMAELKPPQTSRFEPGTPGEMAFRKEVSEIVGDATVWTTDAPDMVYSGLWREADGTVAIQFLNATGGGWPVGEVVQVNLRGPVFPPLERDVSFTIRSWREVRVTVAGPGLVGERELAAVRRGTELAVVVPHDALRTYAIVRIRCR